MNNIYLFKDKEDNLKSCILISLKECINKKLYEMYQDIPKKELGSRNNLFWLNYDEFIVECNKRIKEETEINKELNATTSIYILYDNYKPIGEVGIRTTQSNFWANKGSQIYYKIRKSERGKGYGNIILLLALEKAKILGFKKIRINCSVDNVPSKKVILKNGGVLDIDRYYTKEGTSSSYIINLDKIKI